ncbi:hypothetical protein GC163_17415 [bacterium]|nr:hypothetical protein [bacterium]
MVQAEDRKSHRWGTMLVAALAGAGISASLFLLSSRGATSPLMQLGPVMPAGAEVDAAPARLPDTELPDLQETNSKPPEHQTSAKGSAVRSIIEQQLPDATAEEHEIWFNQLKNLPPGVVEDMLRLRQEIRRPNSPLWNPLPSLSLPPATIPPSVPHASKSVHTGLPSMSEAVAPETIDALRRMREVHRQNLLHAHTRGYCRQVPMVSPVQRTSPAGQSELALRWDGISIEYTEQHVIETHHALDLMATGECLLEIATPDGSAYTPSARIVIDAEGRMGVSAGTEIFPLVPEVTVPATMVHVAIDSNGQVRGWTVDSKEPEKLGQLLVALPRNAASMTYGPQGWLIPQTPEAPIHRAVPGTGYHAQLMIGYLTTSNIDVEDEQARLDEVETWLEQMTLLPSAEQDLPEATIESLPTY